MNHVVDTHVRGKDLSMVYTKESVLMESSIQIMDYLLVEDKYQVVGFDLEFTIGRARQDQKVGVSHFCVPHGFLLYQYHLATRPCKHFTRFINSPDYRFAIVDTTNDRKVLDVSGLTCENIANIED
ncbi:hypothetical protein D1007_17732 [Hordeum vulgare]|nr:hypothetical protein D1007_17732 [Hordeum vulgare]